MKSDRPVSGNHQEAVGAETTWDVSHVEPDERSHSSRAEGNVVSRLILVYVRLQENRVDVVGFHRHACASQTPANALQLK